MFRPTAVMFVALCIGCAQGVATGEDEGEQQERWINIHSSDRVFLAGDPVFLRFDYTNRSAGRIRLRMNNKGLPGLSMTVQQYGKRVPRWTWWDYAGVAIDAHGDPPVSELYLMEPGERVTLCYDLQRMFQIRRAGRYTVTLDKGGLETAETTIEVAGILATQRTYIEAFCNRLRPLKEPEFGNMKVSCHIDILKAITPDGEERCYARVHDIDTKLDLEPHQQMTLRMPLGSQLVQQELDVKMLLWTILKANEKQTLVIWDLLRGTTRIPIPWTDQKIEMVTTRANRDIRGVMVLAGLPGETRISSLSVASEGDDVNKAFVDFEHKANVESRDQ